jgi:hypothetical protein
MDKDTMVTDQALNHMDQSIAMDTNNKAITRMEVNTQKENLLDLKPSLKKERLLLLPTKRFQTRMEYTHQIGTDIIDPGLTLLKKQICFILNCTIPRHYCPKT